MINNHLRLIVNIAKPYQGRGLPLLELIEKGRHLGLIQAIETFDPEKEGDFPLMRFTEVVNVSNTS